MDLSVQSVIDWLRGTPAATTPKAGAEANRTQPLQVKYNAADYVPEYPDGFDVDASRKYDLSYGDPAARFLEPGLASINEVPRRDAVAFNEDPRHVQTFNKPVDPRMASELHQGWLASRNSAISQLGYNPDRLTTSPPTGPFFNIAGSYWPKQDGMWWDRNYPSALVHEGFHRGLKMLRDKSLYDPKSFPEEEFLVRALMQRHFGNVEQRESGGNEHEQIEAARYMVQPKHLDELEDIAAQYLARKRPGGPR